MKEMLAVFIGSGIGGVTRFILSKWINNISGYAFSLGTLFVNIIACLIVGYILAIENKLPANTRFFLAAGFCGGFSTFSAFSGETFLLLQQGQYAQSIFYVTASILVCVGATFAGYWIAEILK